tara:strand:+ start:550 stop:693 length:144 start_codon:yes stop_codon:yes gene_type:complete
MTEAANLYREIAQIEALIESPEGKGKLTVLKAYHRKLVRQYLKALRA